MPRIALRIVGEMMTTKADTRPVSRTIVSNSWTSAPAVVLLTYLILGLVTMLAGDSLLRAGLATVLALMGSGWSLVTALFPRPTELDAVERAALTSCLSLAVGGLLGFFLARSSWGLGLVSFFAITGLFNLGCCVIVRYRRRGAAGSKVHLWPCGLGKLIDQWTHQGLLSQLITVGLVALLISAAWAFIQAVQRPSLDPSMTEFFLLDQDGLLENYPKTALAGEPLTITYGTANREREAALYRVRALIGDVVVGNSQSTWLNPGEAQETQIEVRLPKQVVGPTKVEFILYREDRRYRSLHLWLKVKKAGPSLSMSSSAFSFAH